MKHWLYGEDTREHKVDEESECDKCIHLALCTDLSRLEGRIPRVCLNYTASTSSETGCQACLHKHTRYDRKQPIPCFLCKHYASATQLARVTGS